MKTDEELIAEAVAAGKVRRFKMWERSEWEEMTFKERHARMAVKFKASRARNDVSGDLSGKK